MQKKTPSLSPSPGLGSCLAHTTKAPTQSGKTLLRLPRIRPATSASTVPPSTFATFQTARLTPCAGELADIIYQGSLAHPIISKQLGKDLKVGKYWLDISFPDGPPQEYARSGIEVGDDFIALSTQRLSPEQQHRVSRAIWPAAAFNSLYASSRVILAFQYRRLKQALGFESTPTPGSPEARMQHMLQMIQAQQQGKLAPGKTQPESGMPGAGSAPATPDAATSKSPFSWMSKPPMPSSSMEMPLAYHVFNNTLAKSWLPKNKEPPRGTFVVQGLIQVRGSRAVMTFDVNAHYSPKESRFVVINATPRVLKRWHQSPRGGK